MLSDEIFRLEQSASAKTMNWKNRYIESKIPISVVLRIVYLLANVVSPFWHHGIGKKPLIDVLVLGATASLCLGGLFGLSHNFEGVDRDPTKLFRETESRCVSTKLKSKHRRRTAERSPDG